MGDRFPTMFELFRNASAAFGKAGIADRFTIRQYFSPCFVDHLLDDRVGGTGNSLITLTMVVGTDIENIMVFAVVPAYELFVVPVIALLFLLFPDQAEILFDLREQPTAGDDGMCL